MAGYLTDGVPNFNLFTGAEQIPVDTEYAKGVSPQYASLTLQQLANMVSFLNTTTSKTMVAGTRYYVLVNVGVPAVFTGISVKVGGTGGTDNWIVELHDSTGALVATSATAGTLAGTANTFQQIPFTATYSAAAGTYYIAVQSNGTTATLGVIASPTSSLVTGSAAGTFGTGAAITPPTTYTASTGPMALLY